MNLYLQMPRTGEISALKMQKLFSDGIALGLLNFLSG
jgi:hypothetical protein